MPRPDTVRILGFAYAVHAEDHKDFTRVLLGQIDHRAQTIRIQADLTGDDARETLLHEVLHGIDNGLSAGLTEAQVHSISRGLYAVLRDNPCLTKYLTQLELVALSQAET